MKPQITRCPTCGRKQRRSSEANRRYWALLHEISEGIKPTGEAYGSETWHEYFKQRFLGADEVQLPNGKSFLRSHSTADLETAGFAEYLDKVQAWAAQRGVYLQDENAA